MKRSPHLILWLMLSGLSLRAATPATGESFPRFTADGGWCWFSDPRAIRAGGQTLAGWVTSDGTVEVGRWNHVDGTVERQILHAQFERDDHDNPALLALPDGRIAAFYSLHAQGDLLLRCTERTGGAAAWSPERALGFVAPEHGRRGTTYANPVLLSEESNALYVFWRGSDFKPTFAISRDLGATWSVPRVLISRPGADDTNRPYLKLVSDGRGRIDFVFTDGHPRNEPANSVYHVRYEHGAFFRANGERIGTLADLPLDPAKCDRVYDGHASGRAWIWDVAVTAEGAPVIAFTRMPTEEDHRYAFARWDSQQWVITEVCAAGRWFPQTPQGQTEREPHYSGGMALDHRDPFILYTSRAVAGVFEIERWRSPDRGTSWSNQAVTQHSRHDNVRPFVVREPDSAGPALLWLNCERYVHYTDYKVSVRAASARDLEP